MTKSKREVENQKTRHNDSIEWEQAEGFSKYLISTDGQVYSLKSDRLLPQGFTERGYKQVDVCNDEGIKKHMRVHRLVCTPCLTHSTALISRWSNYLSCAFLSMLSCIR